MVMPLVYENIKDMEPDKKSAIYTLVQITKGQAPFCRGQSLRCRVIKKIYTKN